MSISRYSKERMHARAMAKLDGPRLITLADVVAQTTMSRSYIYAAMDSGEFPKQVKLSPRRVAWRLDEIETWIANRGRA